MAIGTTAAIIGASAIGAGSSLLSSRAQGRAAERAADAQVAGADRSAEVYERIARQQMQNMEPFRQLGVSAISPLQALLGLSPTGAQGSSTAAFTGQGQMPRPNMAMASQARPSAISAYGAPQAGMGGFAGYGSRSMEPFASSPNLWNARQMASWAQEAPMDNGQALSSFAADNLQGQGGGALVNRGGGQYQFNGQTMLQASPNAQGVGGQMSALEALQNRPGYQFRLGEGVDAIDASAAGRGMLLSGAQQRALTRYGQDYASNEYDKEINRLLAVMGGGQVATGSINASQGAAGAGIANAYTNAANARASGYLGQGQAAANAWGGLGNAVGGGLGAYGGYKGWFG